ncbi:hypothetical protein GCM10022247_34750 [Allokutzneria multivorans]|uniref:Uncharacterized protein n=1 Tax=Allokutzneria multivorans TaxID=1142134 RepID=A0ABP7SC06_9PSEU
MPRNDQAAPLPFTPKNAYELTTHQDGRELAFRWNIGNAASDGSQRQARLGVTFHKGWGYTATLATVIHVSNASYASDDYQHMGSTGERIWSGRAGRFSRTKLHESGHFAVEALQMMFEAQHPKVLRHFDPATTLPFS